jgi:biotin carboxylase
MKKAIVLGGTHDHIRLIELLKDKNYYVILIDYNNEPVCKFTADSHIQVSTKFIEKIKEIAIDQNVDLIISTSVESGIVSSAYISEFLGLPFYISYENSLKVTSKIEMKEILIRLGIPTSKFIVINSDKMGYEFNDLKLPLVVKPSDSNSSNGITKVYKAEYFINAVDKARLNSQNSMIIVEEFIEGRELSVDLILIDGEPIIVMISETIKSNLSPDSFTIIESNYPVEIKEVVLFQIKKITKLLAFDLGYQTGPFLLQLLEKDGIVNIIEFTARLGGGSKHHLIKRLTGFDILDWFIKIIEGVYEEVKIGEKYKFACMHYLYAENGEIQSFHGFEDLLQNNLISDYFLYKSIGTSIFKNLSSSDRVAGFLIVENDFKTLLTKKATTINSVYIKNNEGKNIVIHNH